MYNPDQCIQVASCLAVIYLPDLQAMYNIAHKTYTKFRTS